MISGDQVDGELSRSCPPTKSSGGQPQKTFRVTLTPYLREGFDKLMQEQPQIRTEVVPPRTAPAFCSGLYLLVPLLLMAGFWMTLRRARDPLGGGGFLGGFSKRPAKRYAAGDKQVTFDDVAGLEQVKHELQEIVEFLKDPKKFQRLGGRVPKGVLLDGPAGHRQDAAGPGRGRRGGRALLLDQRLASSSRCSSASGPAGSATCSRRPRTTLPAILFIDEIDAVGRAPRRRPGRRTRRARADAQPDPQRDGRLQPRPNR